MSCRQLEGNLTLKWQLVLSVVVRCRQLVLNVTMSCWQLVAVNVECHCEVLVVSGS